MEEGRERAWWEKGREERRRMGEKRNKRSRWKIEGGKEEAGRPGEKWGKGRRKKGGLERDKGQRVTQGDRKERRSREKRKRGRREVKEERKNTDSRSHSPNIKSLALAGGNILSQGWMYMSACLSLSV